MSVEIPNIRIRNTGPEKPDLKGEFVLYWMTSYRRTGWNFSLQRAVEKAIELDRPLVILEALRCGYKWASDRLHTFIIEGMADNAAAIRNTPAFYYPYLEPHRDDGKGLLEALAKKASIVITDYFPCFFIPRMVSAASRKIKVPLELVDSNGILPVAAADRVFSTAYSFRRFLQKNLTPFLHEMPLEDPLKELPKAVKAKIPRDIFLKWPPVGDSYLRDKQRDLSSFPIDHAVTRGLAAGGAKEAERIMKDFIASGLARYPDTRNQPEVEGTSGLSPYLHFGHISAHQVLHGIFEKESWFFDRLSPRTSGARSGWWGMSEAAEAFLDELITWRELGFNICHFRADYHMYESLPGWALETLYDHEMDERKYIYSLARFESGDTHDPLWNAAQVQLVREGRIHNYLRMLWGKKILEWSPSPKQALEIMIELNNKYALDGRDPNSYSGIFWTFGRYDRAWGPQRAIFGKIRYMSSKNTARKYGVKNYIKWYGP